MAIDRQRRALSYGLSQALIGIPAAPIISSRAPTTSDKAEIGSTWINKTTNIAYVITSIVANSATWGSTTSTGTAAVVASLTATTGNITATLGDFVATAGDVTVTAGDITVSAGALSVVLGEVVAGTDVTAGRSVIIEGDEGTGSANTTTLTNVIDTTVSTGAGVVLMKTANPGDSVGWIKFYEGTNVRYIPYWANISP